jgi:phosphoribosylformylglycinamidine synthase I
MARVIVIQFPGVNCEYETVRALRASGMDAEILRWNGPLSAIRDAAALVLPGGFSYQDRIRAGVVASKDRIVDEVCSAAARGIPVLGICNGAQILVEAGIVPDFRNGIVGLALSPNSMPDRTGYFCTWVRLKKGPSPCLFTTFLDDWDVDNGTIPCPIAHAEGRFVTSIPEVQRKLAAGIGVALYYSGPSGSQAETFPDNPNGSVFSIAGVTDGNGSVLALMPHPERASWLYQVPANAGGYWGQKRMESSYEPYAAGPGRGVFDSLKKAIL